MASRPAKNAITVAMSVGMRMWPLSSPAFSTLRSSKRPAPVIAGMPRMDEKRAAVARCSPRKRPVVMVEPLREGAGDQRGGLAEAHDHRVEEGHLREVARVRCRALGDGHDECHHDERRRHHHQRSQASLDGVLENQAEHRDRDAPHDDAERHA